MEVHSSGRLLLKRRALMCVCYVKNISVAGSLDAELCRWECRTTSTTASTRSRVSGQCRAVSVGPLEGELDSSETSSSSDHSHLCSILPDISKRKIAQRLYVRIRF